MSNLSVMLKLLKYLKPLLIPMIFAVLFGVLGHLSATMIPYLSLKTVLNKVSSNIILLIVSLGVLRAILRYLEQLLNHHIAFKILAEIRHHVFDQLQKLSPSKIERKNKGDLITLITSDIELIEVFYAHTISPILIFIIYISIILFLIFQASRFSFVVALISHSLIVWFVPKLSNKRSKETGLRVRNHNGKLSGDVLSSIYGLFSISQFQMKDKKFKELSKENAELSQAQNELRINLAFNHMASDAIIYTSTVLMLVFNTNQGQSSLLLTLVLYLSSFGPSIALANLGFDLQETLASAKRIVMLLEEAPEVTEISDGHDLKAFESLVFDSVSFAYHDQRVLNNINFTLNKHEIVGIKGKSGHGKSTFLKLMMRFWDVSDGVIKINNHNIKDINTESLRSLQSYMSQDAILFEDSILYNIAFNDPRFSQEAVEEAAKKAAIHEFIMNLKDGYKTKLSELGDSLSAGEKQRISLARMFLFDHDIMLFDEPTSNLDSYNESLILKSIIENSKDKTIIIVSHRESTLRICDRILAMEVGHLKEV